MFRTTIRRHPEKAPIRQDQSKVKREKPSVPSLRESVRAREGDVTVRV